MLVDVNACVAEIMRFLLKHALCDNCTRWKFVAFVVSMVRDGEKEEGNRRGKEGDSSSTWYTDLCMLGTHFYVTHNYM